VALLLLFALRDRGDAVTGSAATATAAATPADRGGAETAMTAAAAADTSDPDSAATRIGQRTAT
jgi:hypothetical protein